MERRRSTRIAKLAENVKEIPKISANPAKRMTKIEQKNDGIKPKKRAKKEEQKDMEIDDDPAVEIPIPIVRQSSSDDPIDVNDRPTSRSGRPQRTSALNKSYKTEDDMIEISSSSSDIDSSSDDSKMEMVFEVKEKKNTKKKSRESHDSDSDTDEENVKKKPARRMSKRSPKLMEDKGDPNFPKCRKASIARKTGNPPNSDVVKSGLRMAPKPKPPQPWTKNLVGYEKDRKMSKGERRMVEYQIVAAAYAKGKLEEVSYDECFKIHEDMKRAYHEGKKLIEAIEKKEREEETGEKESSSEDEWEDMEHFEPVIDDKIEVMLNTSDGDVEKDWWVVYLRQEINKNIRNTWENTHKVHLLCYFYHLNFVVKTALDECLVQSLMLSQLPTGFLKYVGENIPDDVLQKLVKWYNDAFRPLNGFLSITAIDEGLKDGQEARYPATSRLTALVSQKCYETDLDRSILLFCLLVGLESTARICCNVQAISRKWDKKQQEMNQKEMERFRELSKSRSPTPIPSTSEKKEETRRASGKKRGEKKALKHEERNYWVEIWNSKEKRWICIDPLHAVINEPLKIQENATSPISYVFAIDNKYGICEISRRYALDCVKQEFRRRRTNPEWLAATLRLPIFAAHEERSRLERMQLHEELVKRPLPTTLSEFKNHPLYVLEKDLLKFEAIYPPVSQQKPLGTIRGHNVYPRSCVYTLQGETNWLKLARSVKIGEKPYKVVKARPDMKVPVEKRVDQFLDVFGYWQTEPYRRPKVENGRIPRNEYGNVYMFNDSMCPIGCVHLKYPGMVNIGRKLNKDCVQAVVGWAFDGGWTHPVMDGVIVLEEDADAFMKEWMRLEAGKAEREEKKRKERVYENWRRLIKGKLRLNYVRKQFKSNKVDSEARNSPDPQKDWNSDGVVASTSETGIIDNSGGAKKPLTGFSLDDFIKH